jgi:hypothetical protein
VYEYTFEVSKNFTFDTKTLVKQFTLHDRVPMGLPNILKELKVRRKLTTRESILSGAFYAQEE